MLEKVKSKHPNQVTDSTWMVRMLPAAGKREPAERDLFTRGIYYSTGQEVLAWLSQLSKT